MNGLVNVDGMNDLWCSSTVRLLSTQIRMNVMAPVRIRLSLNCHAIQEYENDTKKKQVHNHEHIESGGNLMLFVRSLATDFSKLAEATRE